MRYYHRDLIIPLLFHCWVKRREKFRSLWLYFLITATRISQLCCLCTPSAELWHWSYCEKHFSKQTHSVTPRPSMQTSHSLLPPPSRLLPDAPKWLYHGWVPIHHHLNVFHLGMTPSSLLFVNKRIFLSLNGPPNDAWAPSERTLSTVMAPPPGDGAFNTRRHCYASRQLSPFFATPPVLPSPLSEKRPETRLR